MLILTRKVPKKKHSRSKYGDRNSIVLTLEDGTTINISLMDLAGNEVRIGVDGPNSLTVTRKEAITDFRGVEYNQRKADLERGGRKL